MKYISNLELKQSIVFEVKRDSQRAFGVRKRKEINQRLSDRKHGWGRTLEKNRKIVYDEWEEFTLFPKGLSIDFHEGVNIIVGDNGKGKTTLLDILKYTPNSLSPEANKEIFLKYMDNKRVKITFDKFPNAVFSGGQFHKTSSQKEYDSFVGMEMMKSHSQYNTGELLLGIVEMQESSNGEVNKDALSYIQEIENCAMLLDEPETSLSLRSIEKQIQKFKTLSTKNQLIIATHHPSFMRMSDTVYDVETHEWVDTEKYLKQFDI